jgi:hypothetical protein
MGLIIVEETEWPRNVLAKEILDNLGKFPHCLLLTKVGQFYEVQCPIHTPTGPSIKY